MARVELLEVATGDAEVREHRRPRQANLNASPTASSRQIDERRQMTRIELGERRVRRREPRQLRVRTEIQRLDRRPVDPQLSQLGERREVERRQLAVARDKLLEAGRRREVER